MLLKEYGTQFIKPGENNEEIICIEAKMLRLILEKNLQIFPNTSIMLRISLVLMTTNCTCERSFSKLKLTDTCLRCLLSQELLNNLTRMSSEFDVWQSICFSKIIYEFAQKKSPKSFYIIHNLTL